MLLVLHDEDRVQVNGKRFKGEEILESEVLGLGLKNKGVGF